MGYFVFLLIAAAIGSMAGPMGLVSGMCVGIVVWLVAAGSKTQGRPTQPPVLSEELQIDNRSTLTAHTSRSDAADIKQFGESVAITPNVQSERSGTPKDSNMRPRAFFPRSEEMTRLLNNLESLEAEVSAMTLEAESARAASQDEKKRMEKERAERKKEDVARRHSLAEDARLKGPDFYAAYLAKERIEMEAAELAEAEGLVEIDQAFLDEAMEELESCKEQGFARESIQEEIKQCKIALDDSKKSLADLLLRQASNKTST